MIFHEVLTRYRDTVSTLKKGYQQERHRISTILKSNLASLDITAITPIEVSDYRDMRLATLNTKTNTLINPATVRGELNLLSAIFGVAIQEWRIVEANPVASVRKPKASRGRTRRLEPREERGIVKYCASRDNQEMGTIIALALETAMRQGEILALEWRNINIRRQVAHLPDTKNGTPRDVPLSAVAVKILKEHALQRRVDDVKVFRYGSAGLKSAWRTMMLSLGYQDLHFHDLRHEATSRLFELGTLDIMEIASITGHKSLAMLKRYTHLRVEKIVRKLDAAKTHASRLIQRYMVPYPVDVTHDDGQWIVEVPDIEGLTERDPDRQEALRKASYQLLRALLHSMRSGERVPQPSTHETGKDLIFIDPLQEDCAIETVC